MIVPFVAALLLAGAPSPDRDLPALNEAVVRFCEDKLGESVGGGSCAAVADEALTAAGAKTARDFDATQGDDLVWGTPVERIDDLLPGDVVQFRGVKLGGRTPTGTRFVRTYLLHTAVVARNRGEGRLDVYEQNVFVPGANAERRAMLRKREVDFRGLVAGTVRFYRPEAR